ncbi:MAG: outer membrane protein assembly factor BamA [candidate division Zixibacteria bacterium]|nr:outer membrane protein assembly factor BamA [candidate division Zixibacteria bacterium]
MKRISFVIIALLFTANIAQSAVEDYYGKAIVSVKLSETYAADSFLVYNSSGLVPGEILTGAMLQDAVKKIYALGIFSDVAITGELVSGGVNLFINVVPYPRVSKIQFKDNNKIKDKTLKKELTINEGRIISPGAIKTNVSRIKKLYEEKGYLMAVVESDIVPDDDNPDKAVLTFIIEEGSKVKVRDITFFGNENFTDNKLRSKISTKKKSFFRTGTFDREKYREDKGKIIDFYKNEGYIDAVIIADSIIYADDSRMQYSVFAGTTYVEKPDIFIKIYIDEGKRYYFGNFTWEGNEIFDDNKLSAIFKVKEGEKYNQEKYDNMLFKIYEMYQDEGYWYVQIDENKTPRDKILDVHFTLVENQAVSVRMIHIEGNTKTKDKVIRRELKIKPNQIFKRSILGRSLREVMMLNFFGNVTPDWTILDNGDIDLIIKVEEKPTGQFNVGTGYSQSDGFVGTFGIGWPNFLGGGQTLTFNSDYGNRRKTFNLSYYDPWFLDTPTFVGGSVYVQERDERSRYYFTEQKRGGSIRIGRRLRWPDNYFKIFSSYRLEEVKYYSFSSNEIDTSSSIYQDPGPHTKSVLSLTIERDSRDLAMFPTKGASIYWTGELGGTFLRGDWDFYKHTMGISYYYTPLWKLTLGLKGKWGFAKGIYDTDKDVPYADRFFPGGISYDGTIRGYDDYSIGPKNDYNNALGGRSEVIYNLEITVPIADQQFYILCFADAGNAYSTGDGLKDNFYKNFNKSAGFGFRVVAPMIGIIGFDFGWPFNGPSYKRGMQYHFQIGKGF